jgi:hypothetical protein
MTATPRPLVIEVVKLTNCGDHAEQTRTAHEVVPGETVDALVERLFPDLAGPNSAWARMHDYDAQIVIRVATPAPKHANTGPF